MNFKVLLPTDFSDNAWSAIIYALKLYKNEICTFYFLHSTHLKNSSSRTYITTHYVDQLEKEAKEKLKDLQIKVKNSNPNTNHNFENLTSLVDLPTAINNAVIEHNIDVVVMGTKGASHSIDYFAGSNTVDTIKKVKNCPVLIVPDQYEYSEINHLAFPTDYNRFYSDMELKPLKHLADLYNSKIRIFHINEEKELSSIQKHHMKMIDEYLLYNEHSFYWLSNYTKKSEAIQTFIDELQIDLLVLVNHTHSLMESILNEPVVKKLAFHPKIPILVITA